MISRIPLVLVLLLTLTTGVLYFSNRHYLLLYQNEQQQRKAATELAASRLATITVMTERQHKLEQLDARYTQEIASARQETETLRLAVHTGTQRLHVRATCMPASPGSAAASVDDGKPPRLTADAEQHYYRLRDQIATVTSQVNGLQDYIREQCQNRSIREKRQAR